MKMDKDDAGSGSFGPASGPNPHSWVTHEVLLEFFKQRGVKMECELCGSPNLSIIDGGEGPLVGSLPAYGRRPDGIVDTNDSRHMPVARVWCVNCGNVRLHVLYALDIWKQFGPEPVGARVRVEFSDD